MYGMSRSKFHPDFRDSVGQNRLIKPFFFRKVLVQNKHSGTSCVKNQSTRIYGVQLRFNYRMTKHVVLESLRCRFKMKEAVSRPYSKRIIKSLRCRLKYTYGNVRLRPSFLINATGDKEKNEKKESLIHDGQYYYKKSRLANM